MGNSVHSCLFVLSACHDYSLIPLFSPRTLGIPELAGGIQWANNFPHTTTKTGICIPGTRLKPDMVICMCNPYGPMATWKVESEGSEKVAEQLP